MTEKIDLEPIIVTKKICKYFKYSFVNPFYNLLLILTIVYSFDLFLINLIKNKYNNNNNNNDNNNNLINLYNFINKEYYNIIYNSFIINIFLISTLIYILDNYIFKNHGQIWNYISSNYYCKNKISSSEFRYENNLVKYKINTYSSTFFLFIGNYLFIRSNYVSNKLSTINAGYFMIIIGILSILWWSSTLTIIRKLDHIFMETHSVYLSLSFITLINNNYVKIINILIILFILLRFYTLNQNAKIGNVLLFKKIMIFSLCLYFKNVGNVLLLSISNLFILLSFIMKVTDNVFNFKWGTGLFHIFAPLGLLLSYEWSQTLVNIEK